MAWTHRRGWVNPVGKAMIVHRRTKPLTYCHLTRGSAGRLAAPGKGGLTCAAPAFRCLWHRHSVAHAVLTVAVSTTQPNPKLMVVSACSWRSRSNSPVASLTVNVG